jgi:hypothetical protein
VKRTRIERIRDVFELERYLIFETFRQSRYLAVWSATLDESSEQTPMVLKADYSTFHGSRSGARAHCNR